MHITVNGQPVTVQAQSLFALKAELQDHAEVVILNGYQTAEDLPLRDGDTVTLIRKGVMPAEPELEQMLCARHTPAVHEKVKNASIAIAGLGGLGSNIAVMLARTGVGRLLLVDFDTVEPSNLNRQCYFISHLGMKKTEAMQSQLRQINPYITVETETVRVTAENAAELFRDADIICEAFDDPAAKATLTNTVLTAFPEKKLVASSGMAGYGSANTIRTRKVFRNLYLCGDGETAAQPGCGLMAPRVTVCAAHQANMILRLLLNMDEP